MEENPSHCLRDEAFTKITNEKVKNGLINYDLLAPLSTIGNHTRSLLPEK